MTKQDEINKMMVLMCEADGGEDEANGDCDWCDCYTRDEHGVESYDCIYQNMAARLYEEGYHKTNETVSQDKHISYETPSRIYSFNDTEDTISSNTTTAAGTPEGLAYPFQNAPQRVGWVCPKCGRALSPTTTECSCYKEKNT